MRSWFVCDQLAITRTRDSVPFSRYQIMDKDGVISNPAEFPQVLIMWCISSSSHADI